MTAHPPEAGRSQPRSPRRVLGIVVLLVLALVFLGAGVLVYVRTGLDDALLTRLAVSQLGRLTGKRVFLRTARLTWASLDRASVSLEGLELRDKTSGDITLRVSTVVLEVECLRLLRGRLLANRVTLSEPELFLTDRHIIGRRPDAPERPSRSVAPWLSPEIRRIEVHGGRVGLRDPRANEYSRVLMLSGISAVGVNLSSRGAESFLVKGLAEGNGHSGALRITGQFLCADRAGSAWQGEITVKAETCPVLFLVVAASLVGRDLPIVDGLADFNIGVRGRGDDFVSEGEIALSRLVIRPGGPVSQAISTEPARVRYVLKSRKDGLDLALPAVDLPGLRLTGSVEIRGGLSESATGTVAIQKAELDLERFFPIIPLELLQPEDRDRVREVGMKGRLVINEARWTGQLADLFRDPLQGTSLDVSAYLDRVSGFVPVARLPVHDATGRMRLSWDQVEFSGISFTLGSSPIVLNGSITDLRGTARADLFVSMTAQGQDLGPLLENKAVIRKLGGWVTSIEEPRGGISVTLAVKGDLKRPAMTGRVSLDDFHFRVAQFPLPLKKVHGSLRFRRSGVEFAGLRAIVGDSSVELGGKLFPEDVSVTAEVKVSPGDLKALQVVPPSWSISGSIPVSVAAKGRVTSVQVSAKADLKRNAIQIGRVVSKSPGASLLVELSGARDAQGTRIEEAYLVLDQTRISAKAEVEPSGNVSVFVNLPPNGIPTGVLTSLADPSIELQSGGRIEGDGVIRINHARGREITVDTSLQLSHISLKFPGMYKRTEGLTGTIRWQGSSVTTTVERAKVGSSELSGKIHLTGFDRPKLEIVADFTLLDTADFSAPPGRQGFLTWGEYIRASPIMALLARSRGTAAVHVARGKTRGFAFANLRANYEGKDGIIRASRAQVNFGDGLVRGDVVFDIRPDTKKPVVLEFQGEQVRVQSLLTADSDRFRIDGSAQLAGRMEWRLTDKMENNGISRSGQVTARTGEGVIHRFEVLSKIFSLVNLGSLLRGRFPDIGSEGLAFRRMSWSTEIFDHKWKVRDLKLVSDAANIESSGMYFSDQQRVDFRVAVSPLVGLDTLVSGILGPLITGDPKTLTTTFRVRGLVGSPDVRLEPFEQFRSEGN